MAEGDPQFDGQTKSVMCPQAKRRVVRVARYREGELLWWCNHGNKEKPREIIKRKK